MDYAFFEITAQGVSVSGQPETDPALLQELVRRLIDYL
jgi:hypothetical protein